MCNIRKQKNIKDIANALSHVLYEYDMLTYTNNALNNGIIDPLYKNLVLEGFLSHARNLIHFFNNKLNDKDDIISSDFDLDFNFKIEDCNFFVRRICKEILHLTYKRSHSPKEKSWIDFLFPNDNAESIYYKITEKYNLFINKVKNQYPEIIIRKTGDDNTQSTP